MATVLIVDDSKFMRKMLSSILVETGHEVVGEAENAREALEFCNRLRPDLVTLDIIMPEVEGVDTLSGLKTIVESTPQTRVVMVSSMGQEDVMKECLDAGAREFITKPFQPSQIAEAVQRVLAT